jgi:hypothetical protein
MTQSLRDSIAAAVVLITDAKQDPEQVHKLLQALCDEAHLEGYMVGLDKAQALMDKHLGALV